MELIIHDFELPLLHPFTISRETITVQPSVIVELREGNISGYGEATTNSYYGATKERLRQSLETCRDLVESTPWEEPCQLWELAREQLNDSFALCALEFPRLGHQLLLVLVQKQWSKKSQQSLTHTLASPHIRAPKWDPKWAPNGILHGQATGSFIGSPG